MSEFIIKIEQLQSIMNILGNLPAKDVLNAIDMLRNLPPYLKEETNKELKKDYSI